MGSYPVAKSGVNPVMGYFVHIRDQKRVPGKILVYGNPVGLTGARTKVTCLGGTSWAELELEGCLQPQL
jgi:hypothetical protein